MILIVIGQAMNYLGITDGKLFQYQGWKRDSSYTPLGNSGSYTTKSETLYVNQSFMYSGNPGKGIYTATYYQSSSTIFEDTVYEISNNLRRLYIIGKNSNCTAPYKVDIKALVTPFTTGNKWSIEIANPNPYVGDFDGDCSSQYVDSLWWSIDTATVVGQENVTVPSGSYNAYKIWIRLKGQIWSSQVKIQGGSYGFNPKSDSVRRDYYLWWVPNLGYVKDSLYSFTRFSGPFGSSIRILSWEVSELKSTSTSIAEKRDNILFSKGIIKFDDKVKIYSISGKVIFEGKGNVKLNKGIYLLDDGRKFVKLIVD